MNKQKFIERLRSALNGRISPNAVLENINYYEDYINTEVRKGRTEAEVLQELGDPRLIARTIIETNGRSEQAQQGTAEQRSDYRSTDYQGEGSEEQKRFHLPGWLWLIIIILIVVVILSAVMSILSFLAPVIIVFAVVVFLVKLFRDWLN